MKTVSFGKRIVISQNVRKYIFSGYSKYSDTTEILACMQKSVFTKKVKVALFK